MQKAIQTYLFEEFLEAKNFKKYTQKLWQQEHLAEISFVSEDEGSGNENLISVIQNDQWESPDPKSFFASLSAGKRPEMLAPYSITELGEMNLFKAKGYNAGFAITQDGSIVAVHNNTGISGVGTELMNAAKRNGGTKGDHFDGFLTGFYKRFGFKVVKHEEWNDDYAPKNWKYTPIDFYDPEQSIYAEKANSIPEAEWPQDLINAKKRYDAGKPDIVYRKV